MVLSLRRLQRHPASADNRRLVFDLDLPGAAAMLAKQRLWPREWNAGARVG